MQKRVLVAYYSQTGQLRRAVESLCAPLAESGEVEIVWQPLQPAQPFPFPWPVFRFFEQFPECVYCDPAPNQPLTLTGSERFDLVILGYTVWFLSPAPPVTAFLQSAAGKSLLHDTPVVTLIACRNMWLSAHGEVQRLLAVAGARHCDNIVLTDKGSSFATFITTPRWMLTGKTDSIWGLPPPGVPAADIAGCRRFGLALLHALRGGWRGEKPALSGLQAVTVDDRLIASERIGRRSFVIWGRLVRAAGGQGTLARRAVLMVYIVFLVAMILTVVPVTMALRALLRPLLAQRLARLKQDYEQPSGSGSERISEFQ